MKAEQKVNCGTCVSQVTWNHREDSTLIRVSVGFSGFQWVSVGFCGFQWVSVGFGGFRPKQLPVRAGRPLGRCPGDRTVTSKPLARHRTKVLFLAENVHRPILVHQLLYRG